MKIQLLLLALFQMHAWAGNKVGNGGDVVFCKSKKSWEILDFHEARQNKLEIVSSPEKDPYAIVKKRLEPLESLAPALHKQYLRRLGKLADDIEFREAIELTDVKDSVHAFIGKGCKIQQAAIRLGFPQYNKGKQFVIDKDLWGKLSSTEKAGLLLHEMFYEHVSKLGITDSRPVRQFVSFMFSNQSKSISKAAFWAKMNEWGVPIYPQ